MRLVNEQTGRPAENPVERVLRDGVVVGLANHTVLVARDGTSRPIDDSGAPIHDEDEWHNPNIVKVVTDAKGFAIYFSRATIPYPRNDVSPYRDPTVRSDQKVWGHRHLGLYVYRRDFLLRFARLRPTWLEQTESLEQLRALVYGHRIYVAAVDDRPVEVDTPEDLVKAKNYLNQLRN